MSTKKIVKEAREAMEIAGQDFIALVYNPKYGPCYWVAEDGRCVLECSIESKKILDSNELKEEFDKDNLNSLEVLEGLYHIIQK